MLFSKPQKIKYNHVLEKVDALNQLNSVKNYSITWLGHAAFLIKLKEKHILTDPFLSKNAGPWKLGPKREIASPINLEDLPRADIILISHNHYDHLDSKVIKSFPYKKSVQVIVPIGLKKFFAKRGFTNITEMNWWEDLDIENIKVKCFPCVHFSGRGLFDGNKTLWASFSVEDSERKVWFSGDTANGEVFKEIGNKEKYFDIALVGIGAYEPRDFMRSVHASPEDAVEICQAIKAQKAIGMHWGTIRLTPEPLLEPAERFKKAAEDKDYGKENAIILKIGESLNL